VFELLQHLLQASCYKAKRRISLLTDLLTRVLLTDAILRYWKKQAFTVETDWQPMHWQPKGSISNATLLRFKRAWGGQLARVSNLTKITKLKSEVCRSNRRFRCEPSREPCQCEPRQPKVIRDFLTSQSTISTAAHPSESQQPPTIAHGQPIEGKQPKSRGLQHNWYKNRYNTKNHTQYKLYITVTYA
jgi:hypothetical protein